MTKILNVSGRKLKLDTRADIEPVLKDVDPTIIEEIHFDGNTIGVDASEALAEFLEKTKVLRVANFADIYTGRLITEIPQSLALICDALKTKETLVEINLSDNAFGGRSVDPMVPFLTHNRYFQILRLNNNGLGPAGGAVIADALRESARLSKAEGKTSNLRTVICGRNRLENGSAKNWAEAFAAHGTLTEVRMPQNGIRMEGITALAEGLSKCLNLEHLDFQDNTFSEEDEAATGVKAWADALPLWTKLRTLNLSDCVLASEGDEDVPLIISTIAGGSNPHLHTLQLQNNNLTSQSSEALSTNFSEHLTNLRVLELQWNEIEEDDPALTLLISLLSKQGGKLYINDEDEEEEKEKEEEIPEQKADKDADELADLLGKVTISAEAKN